MRQHAEGAANGLKDLVKPVVRQAGLIQVVEEIVAYAEICCQPRSQLEVVLSECRPIIHAVCSEIRRSLTLECHRTDNARRCKTLGIPAIFIVNNHVGIVEERQRSGSQQLAAVRVRYPADIPAELESVLAGLYRHGVLKL